MNEKPMGGQENTREKGMYFDPVIAERFADLEQNEKNYEVARAVDAVLMTMLPNGPVHAAELGGGAHADRYDAFFKELLKREGSKIDWVDHSPHMLNLVDKYLGEKGQEDRLNVIKKIEAEILVYLKGLNDDSLDLVISKYTLNYLSDPQMLVKLLSQKLKSGGQFIATVGRAQNELKSHSTNARYLYQGKAIPEGQTIQLKDGDQYTVQFLKESGNPDGGVMPGAETIVYHHDIQKLGEFAESLGLQVFFGDWKKLVNNPVQAAELDVLVVTK